MCVIGLKGVAFANDVVSKLLNLQFNRVSPIDTTESVVITDTVDCCKTYNVYSVRTHTKTTSLNEYPPLFDIIYQYKHLQNKIYLGYRLYSIQ